MILRRLILLLTVLVLAACNRPVPSARARLSEVHFDVRALAVSGSRTEVKATLWRSGTFLRRPLELTGGDRLVAEVGGTAQEMAQPPQLEGTGQFQADEREGRAETPVRLRFLRKDGSSAVAAGALPQPFEIAELPRSPSASQPLEVRWSPAGPDPMEIVVEGPCVSTTTDWMPEDAGRFVLPPGTLRPPVLAIGDCWVDLTVARLREGRVDRGLHPGSSFLVRQVRTVRLRPVR
jgi:hypothetical protein